LDICGAKLKYYLKFFLLSAFCVGCSLLGGDSYSSLSEYQMQPGDSLWEIAQRHGVSTQQLAKTNNIQNPKNIPAGSTIKIPLSAQNEVRARYKKGGISSIDSSSFDSRLSWPLKQGKFMSGFGPRGKRKKFHDGIDIAAKRGTPVYAAHSGTIAYSGSGLRGYGKLLILLGEDSFYTVYAHNSRLNVRKGDKVYRGQQIAKVGATGKASGPHLHFEVRMKDKKGRVLSLDPIPLLNRFSVRKPRFRINESLTPILSKKAG